MKTYASLLGVLFALVLCGCGHSMESDSVPRPFQAQNAPQDDVHAFLTTMRGLPLDQRTAYAAEHQEIAQKALQSTDSEVKKLVEELKY